MSLRFWRKAKERDPEDKVEQRSAEKAVTDAREDLQEAEQRWPKIRAVQAEARAASEALGNQRAKNNFTALFTEVLGGH